MTNKLTSEALIDLEVKARDAEPSTSRAVGLAEFECARQEFLESASRSVPALISELREVAKEYGDDRRTEIIEEQAEILLEDLIPVEDVAVTISRQGYLKRTPVDTYKNQGRGGKGRIGMKTREEDFVERVFVASTHSYLLIFTNRGKVYWLKVYEIPDVGTAGRGKNIVNLVNFDHGERLTAVMAVKEFSEEIGRAHV